MDHAFAIRSEQCRLEAALMNAMKLVKRRHARHTERDTRRRQRKKRRRQVRKRLRNAKRRHSRGAEK